MFDARRMFDDTTCFPVATAAAIVALSLSSCDRDSGESVESQAVAAKAGDDGGAESESGGESESSPDEESGLGRRRGQAVAPADLTR